jgi:hypothetical protein
VNIFWIAVGFALCMLLEVLTPEAYDWVKVHLRAGWEWVKGLRG